MAGDYELRRIGTRDLGRLTEADPRLADPARAAHIGELLGAGLSWAAFDAGGAMLGFAIVTRHFFGFPFVDLLVTAQAARRRGIGSALMAKCEAAHDADRIFTSTNESNAPMRALLWGAGWRPAGVVHYLDPGDPELMFVKLKAEAT
jgi:GNAT superfamily N-acetyltransferase